MMKSVEKDDTTVEYDEDWFDLKKILIFHYLDMDTYKWSKSVFEGARARNAIGDKPLDGLNFSFCEKEKNICLECSDKDATNILYFLREENHLKLKKADLKTNSEISEKTSLTKQSKRSRNKEQQNSVPPLKKRFCP